MSRSGDANGRRGKGLVGLLEGVFCGRVLSKIGPGELDCADEADGPEARSGLVTDELEYRGGCVCSEGGDCGPVVSGADHLWFSKDVCEPGFEELESGDQYEEISDILTRFLCFGPLFFVRLIQGKKRFCQQGCLEHSTLSPINFQATC